MAKTYEQSTAKEQQMTISNDKYILSRAMDHLVSHNDSNNWWGCDDAGDQAAWDVLYKAYKAMQGIEVR